MKWGSGSQHLTALLKQASEDVLLKAAAGASAAAGMLGDQQMAEQQQQLAQSQGPASKSDQLRQMAEMEPDMQKKQFLLSVADSIDNANAPVEVSPNTSQMMDTSQEMMMQGNQPQAAEAQGQQKAASDSDFGEVVSNSPDFSFNDDGKYAGEMSAQDFENYLLNT
jgi:N-methylhydantoinase A/oxoprolinase/acetone carboxylase beta subunit